MTQSSPSSDPRRSQDPQRPAQDPQAGDGRPAKGPSGGGGRRPNPATVAVGLLLLVLLLALGAFFGMRAYLEGASGADGARPGEFDGRPSVSQEVALPQA